MKSTVLALGAFAVIVLACLAILLILPGSSEPAITPTPGTTPTDASEPGAAPDVPAIPDETHSPVEEQIDDPEPTTGEPEPADAPSPEADEAQESSTTPAMSAGDARVLGLVVDAHGNPLPGVDVRLQQVESQTAWRSMARAPHRVSGVNAQATTDAQGEFEVTDLARGNYAFELRLAGSYASAENPDHVTTGENVWRLTMQAGGSIQGHVRDATGAGLNGAHVAAGPADPVSATPAQKKWAERSTSCKEDGGYRLDGMPAGEWKVTASHPRFASESSFVLIGEVESLDDIDLVLTPGLQIVGRVIDTAGRPIAGVQIVASPSTHDADEVAAARNAKSEEDGAFSLEGLEPLTYSVFASADDFIQSESRNVIAGTLDCEIVLVPGARLSGIVRRPDGSPAAGAQVECSSAAQGSPFNTTRMTNTVGADEEGRFEVASLAAGKQTLVGTMQGYLESLPQEVDLETGENFAEITLDLREGVSISGRVIDSSGAGLAGATVSANLVDKNDDTFVPYRAYVSRGGGQSKGSVPSGKDGSFKLDGLSPQESYRVVARLDDYVQSEDEASEQSIAPPAAGIIVRLERGASISGTVTGSGGLPIAGAMVQLTQKERNPFTYDVSASSSSDSEGAYELPGVSPGDYEVRASHNEYQGSTALPVSVAGGEVVEDLDLVLERGGEITGQVVSESGEPVPDASVMAMAQSSLMSGQPEFKNGSTGEDGSFLLQGIGEGTYVMRATAEGFVDAGVFGFGAGVAQQTAQAGEFIVITLSRGGTIAGQVVDTDGAPVTSFNVQVMQSQTMWRGAEFPGQDESISSVDGVFEITGAAPESSSVVVKAAGFADLRVPLTNFDAAGYNQLGVLKLSSGATITGTVTDPGGAPLEGAQVELFAKESGEGGMAQLTGMGASSTTTDAEGAFRMEHIPAGERRVVARHKDFTKAEREVDVPDRGEVGPVRLALGAGGRIVGHVVDQTGEPRAGVMITAMPTSSGMVGFGTDSKSDSTDREGRYAISGLGAGVHTVMAQMPSTSGGFSQRMKTVEVLAGVDVVCDFVEAQQCRLFGTVHGWDAAAVGGNPQASMMMLFAIGGSSVSQTMTQVKEDGSYSFDPMPAGDYQIMLMGSTTVPVTLPSLPEFRHDIQLPSGAISGQVRRADEAHVSMTQVHAVRRDTGKFISRFAQTITGEGGTFELHNLNDGIYDVYCEIAGAGAARVDGIDVTGGRHVSGVDLVIDAGGVLIVTVLGDGGRPMVSATVICQDDMGNPVGMGSMAMSMESEEKRLEGMTPGVYRVIAGSPTEGTAWVDGVQVDAGLERRLEIRLPVARGKLEVTVTSSGAPAPGASVEILDASGNTLPDLSGGMMSIFGGATTDENGVTTTGFLPPGKVTIRVTSGSAPAIEKPATIPSDGSTAKIQIAR